MQNKNIKLFSLLAISTMLFACGGGENQPSNEQSTDPVVSESVEQPSENESVEQPSENESVEQPSENESVEQPSENESAGQPEVEEPSYVTSVEAEKAYKLMIDQKGAGKKLYYAGGYVATYYGATTEDANAAINLVLKETEGGYYLGYLDGTTSTFINALPNDTHNNIKFETTPKSVWTFNTEHYTLTTTCGENTVYMGTFGTYTTLSLSTVDHLGEENSYPARLYTSDVATPEVVIPEQGGEVEPGTGSNKTIAELLEIGAGVGEGNTTTEKYTFTAKVTAVNGRDVTVTDETGSIIVYNYDTPNLYMDYEVTITGAVKDYYGTIEVVNFTLDSYVAATYEVTFGTMENGSVSSSKTEGIAYNEKVTLTVTPNDGYKLNELYVNGSLTSVVDNAVEITLTQDVNVEATFVTLDTVVVEKELRTYTFSSYPAGTQYAAETHDLDSDVKMSISDCHLNTQLRIYASDKNDGIAVFSSEKEMYGIAFNAGYKNATLNVYVSNDGTNYELAEAVTVVSAYADYSVDFGGTGYKYIKLDAEGAQVRVVSVSITIAK